jgi:DNA repair protein RecO (recombination protein O)
MARSSTTEAVVLRSFRFGEADRVLHLYTHDRGRVGAMAKGVRKTKSRFGARLEPFSHVELVLHEGRGELDTVTGASLVRSHDRVRSEPYRLQVGMIGLEAMLKLFTEQEANEKAFTALTRFLDALDELAPRQGGSRAALDPVVLSFQLKLLWVSGYMPHLDTCVECGGAEPLVAFLPAAGGGVCAACDPGGIPLSPEGVHGIRLLLHSPIAAATAAGLGDQAQREALAVVTASYENHGGFRLKTVSV